MRIAICTPCAGDVAAEYAYSLAKLVARTAQMRFEYNGTMLSPTIELFMRSSSVLPQLRNMLVQDAIGWGADYLFWLDSDHKFPDDTLLRLLSLSLPVVGANYPRRVPPHHATAVGLDGRPVLTTAESAARGEIVPVASMGLGCCLIGMSVIDRLRAHAQATGADSIWPLFALETVGDGTKIVGEDVYFFRKLRAAGIDVHVDQMASWNIGHVHGRVLTNADVPGAVPPTPVAAAPAAPEPQRTTISVRFDPA